LIRLVHEFDGKLPYETLQKIEKEISEMNWIEWSDTQKLAYIGRAALAPEAAEAFGNPDGKSDAATITIAPAAPSGASPTRPTPTTATVTAQSTKVKKAGK
jgi:hypothetical protein